VGPRIERHARPCWQQGLVMAGMACSEHTSAVLIASLAIAATLLATCMESACRELPPGSGCFRSQHASQRLAEGTVRRRAVYRFRAWLMQSVVC
jgi:hypothetical protein